MSNHAQDALFEIEEIPIVDSVTVTTTWRFDHDSMLYDFTVIIHDVDAGTPIEWSTRRLTWTQMDLIADLAEAMRQVRRGHSMLRTF